jgi:hypothetical protein
MQESEFLSALLASQGNVDLTSENELFGQFVGEWVQPYVFSTQH